MSSLGKDLASTVGGHLAAAGRFLDEDPERAWAHAEAARRLGGRLGVVREAAGLAAYRTGRYTEALAELRTARRLTGADDLLPMMADCERGLGRPERAIDMAASAEARRLDREGQIEMLLVTAGARADLGQLEAAVITLQVPALRAAGRAAWSARLRYAYAEALGATGRSGEAERWHLLAREADPGGVIAAVEGDDDEFEVIDLLDGVEPGDDAVEESAGPGVAGESEEPGVAGEQRPVEGRAEAGEADSGG